MKTIEKRTDDNDIMYFEIITSRKELGEWFRDQLFDALYSQFATGTWDNEDASIDWLDCDGKWHGTDIGEKVERPNISKIVKMVSTNESTTVIYGDVKIVKNERYGDWETQID